MFPEDTKSMPDNHSNDLCVDTENPVVGIFCVVQFSKEYERLKDLIINIRQNILHSQFKALC